MTETIFSSEPYTSSCIAKVTQSDGLIIQLDRTIFYPTGGGQPGDIGVLKLADNSEVNVIQTSKCRETGEILHEIEESDSKIAVGTTIHTKIDWPRRYNHMRMHTCLHLLCAVINAPVTGGQLSDSKGRLDFNIPHLSLSKEQIQNQLNSYIEKNLSTDSYFISTEELKSQPTLVRTMKVKPPMNSGTVRLLKISDIDLQPCGGTHVKSTGEIGPIAITKIENKGKHNRRINIRFQDNG